MKKLRVAALVREGLVPPENATGYDATNPPEWGMEFDIIMTLREIGHEVRPIALYDDLNPIRQVIADWKPHISVMMLEEFHGVSVYDQCIVSYLELMKQRYTGCNPRGLLLSHDKALSKKILSFHDIRTPGFVVFRRNRKIRLARRLKYPLLVKSATEDASLGISQSSVVNTDATLAERVRFIHDNVGSDALAEEYIDGREFYVGIIGNQRLSVLPVWEMSFGDLPDDVPHIATSTIKWSSAYQKKYGIDTGPATDLSPARTAEIQKTCKRVYRALHMSGYGRIDLRMNAEGQVYVIEANANPNLVRCEDFAVSAQAVGVSYRQLVSKIINLGLNYHAPWQQ